MSGDPRARPDPAIWDLPTMRAALRRRDITTVYRLLKRHGVAQRRIAALSGQAQPEVSLIARGRQVMAYDVLERIADGLGIPRGYLGLAYSDHVVDGVVTTVPDRREFMGLLAKVAMGAAVTGADLVLLSNPATATPVPARVGATEVGQLRDLTSVLWAQERRLGGGAVREAVIAQLGWARGLLQAAHTDHVGVELRVILADLFALAGRASHDVGFSGAALRYLGQSVVAAQEAEDSARAALALGQIGRLYSRLGNADAARDSINLGMLAAERVRSGSLSALLLCSQARAHAESREPGRAIDYLSRAEDAIAGDNSPAEPSGFNPTLLASERGRVLTVLTVHDRKYATEAIETLLASNERLDPARTKRLAFGLTELATCHLRGGDRETGVRLGHQVIDLAAGIRSERLTEHLGMLRSAASAHAGDARELAERIPV
ncbi:helix-turn-helix domain-containing protein [Actinokineospora inagensis]|uniref:helix-turn-helix domain-containing protein n=1 Tax=Actinokineospora inagensis TaxID=103730 RepID=UPI00041F4564|nr:helix-turn-helix transcriptional regulator [Actinokineospora inagensis]